MIKAIIFDFGGVLSTLAELEPILKEIAKKAGKDPEPLMKILYEILEKVEINQIPSQILWENLAKYLELDSQYLRTKIIDSGKIRTEVIELVKNLKKHYKTGLLSNQIEDWLEEIIRKYELDKIFDAIVTSYGSKKAKPDPAIYEEVAKKLGVKVSECIFIDDWEKYVLSAEKLGMKTILFKNIEQLKKDLKRLGISSKPSNSSL
ncbi:MAG TPA: HAD family phosphatase [Candidatus Nanoarchaeia archaeon]|nr:HAD family phosphatase [Candidatus Nanoarchaeia archaeon]